MRRRDLNELTDREREVLELLRRDFTNEQIAQRLGISADGAKYHVSQILGKLGVESRSEAAALVVSEWRPWWMRGLWLKIGGAATVTAAAAGIALLVWDTDPLPPPGATLSGFVYHDANANGIRDSCDQETVSQDAKVNLLPLDNKGAALEGSSQDGTWTIKEVPPGDYVLTLNQPGVDSYWLTTGPAIEDGKPRYELSVRGFEAIDSLDFGVAYVRPITLLEGRYALVSIGFDDLDSDGEADPGECPLEAPAGFDEVFLNVTLQNGLTEAPTKVGVPDIPNRPLGGRVYTDPCEEIALRQSLVDRIYLETLGLRPRVEGTGVIKIASFLDADLDGLRSETEPFLGEQPRNMFAAFIAPAGANDCLLLSYPPQDFPQPLFPEQLTYLGLPAGEWDVTVDDWSIPPSRNQPGQIATPTGGRTQQVTLQAGETLDLQLALRPASPSYVEVHAIEDLNRNGRADPGEPGADAVPIGYTRDDDGYLLCSSLAFDGISTIGPVINASISVAVEDFCGRDLPEWFSDQPGQEVTVGEGETVSLTLLVYRE